VIPAQFDYVAPATIEEALSALADGGDDAKIMAGGQSLLPVLRMRLNAPELVIDLGRIDSLRGVRDDGDAIVIGAMTPHSEVQTNSLVHEHALLISRAVAEVADPQVRHRGTFGGALAHADPAGDLGGPALALDVQFVLLKFVTNCEPALVVIERCFYLQKADGPKPLARLACGIIHQPEHHPLGPRANHH